MESTAARKARIAAFRAALDTRLGELVPEGGAPLASAMRYALSTPGKRLRPLLTLLTAVQLDRSPEEAMDAACAVEMVHAASLVLDDLPCMDDADMRRGQPSTHARFGQDVAVLTGVALLNQAYAVLARTAHASAADRLQMIEALAGAVGLEGLVAGQALDLHGGSHGGLAVLRETHHRKTGVLFMAAVSLGAVLGGAKVAEHIALERFAAELGLAFQARDDLADAGEKTGRTLVGLIGPEGARAEAEGRLGRAKAALASGGARLEPMGAYVDLLLAEQMVEVAP